MSRFGIEPFIVLSGKYYADNSEVFELKNDLYTADQVETLLKNVLTDFQRLLIDNEILNREDIKKIMELTSREKK